MHVIYKDPLPSGWNEEPLGTLVTTKRGCSWSKEQERDRPAEGTIPVIRIPNIQASLELSNLLHIDGISSDQQAASAVTKGWTLLVGSNGNPKRIGDSVLMEEDREMIFASFLFALRPKLDGAKLTDEFIACWLQAHRVHEFISETSQMTTGLANMSWSACRKLLVRFPQRKEEQTRITETLKAADDYIRALQEQIRRAERVKNALMQSLFVRGAPRYNHNLKTEKGVEFPSKWKLYRLREMLVDMEYGISAAFGEKGAHQILRMENVTNGSVHADSPVYIDLSPKEYERYRIHRGDILFNRTNSWDLVGRVGIAEEDMNAVFASYLVRLKVNTELADPFFLNYALNSPFIKRRYRRFVTPAVSQANINVRNLGQTWIAIPALGSSREQSEIVETLNVPDAEISALINQLTAARRVKQSLLQNLLTGKIRLQA